MRVSGSPWASALLCAAGLLIGTAAFATDGIVIDERTGKPLEAVSTYKRAMDANPGNLGTVSQAAMACSRRRSCISCRLAPALTAAIMTLSVAANGP